MAAKSAWLRGAGRVVVTDPLQYRLNKARQSANCEMILWEGDGENVVEFIRSISNNRRADLCVDAVGFEPNRNVLEKAKVVTNLEKGSPKVLEACISAVRRGGTVSVLGVYPTAYDNFPIGSIFR